MWRYHRAGEMRTREFHDMIERSHHGQIHKFLRRRRLITYDYMREEIPS